MLVRWASFIVLSYPSDSVAGCCPVIGVEVRWAHHVLAQSPRKRLLASGKVAEFAVGECDLPCAPLMQPRGDLVKGVLEFVVRLRRALLARRYPSLSTCEGRSTHPRDLPQGVPGGR